MTILATASAIQYSGIVAGVALTAPFPVHATDEIKVLYGDDVEALPGTHYSVALAVDFSSASITPTTTFVALVGSDSVTLQRATARTQTLALADNSKIPERSYERVLDRDAMRDQEQDDAIARTLAFPVNDPTSGQGPLPGAATRANKVLGFDAFGKPTATDIEALGALSVSDFGRSLVAAVDAEAASLLIENKTLAGLLALDAAAGAGGVVEVFEPVNVTVDITLVADISFRKRGCFITSAGKTTTCNGDVTGRPTAHLFQGSGSVSLAGQRSGVHLGWFGAKADNSGNDCALAWTKLDAALPNGGFVVGDKGRYYMASGYTPTNTIHFFGAGRGLNPDQGGTIFTPLNAFAFGGAGNVLFNLSFGSLVWRDFMVLGASTTDPTQNYTAFKLGNGAGKVTLSNIEIIGCGIGWHVEACASGVSTDCNVYAFSIAAVRTGGLANYFCGPFRFNDAIYNNPNITGYNTTSIKVAGTFDLTLNTVSGLTIGMPIAGYGIPDGTVVTNIVGLTVTLSAALILDVAVNRYVRWGNFLVGKCIEVLGNTFDVYFRNIEVAGGRYLCHIAGSTAGAGVYVPNAVRFHSCNMTAATYNGVKIERGVDIVFAADTWIGDVVAGPTFEISAFGGVNSNVRDVKISDTLIGNGATHALYVNGAQGLSVTNSFILGAGIAIANTFNGMHVQAMTGKLIATGNYMVNDDVRGVTGNAAYGLYLTAGVLAGATDTIAVTGNTFQGTTGAYADGSSPAGTRKVFANNAYI